MDSRATWLVAIALIAGAATSRAECRPNDAGWRTYSVPELGTSVDYPAGIFAIVDGKSEKGFGQQFSSPDRSALLTVYSLANDTGDTPESYLRRHLRADRRMLSYQRVTRSFFAISATRGGLIYYSRCNFSQAADAAVHCFDLVYPSTQRRAWDAVVTRISRSLRPLEG